jgi:CRISPR-associated protein Cas1
VREKILRMSVQERKNLGLNKSTLWYQKKKLTEGKKIKLYNKVLSKIAVEKDKI